MTNFKGFLSIVGWAVVILMVIDFLGFMAWAMSGQMPGDSFFVGSITRHILQAIFF